MTNLDTTTGATPDVLSERRPLGTTGLQVSPVSFGTGPLGEMFGPLDENEAVRLVHEVIDRGINFIDTSIYYGSAEERLGKALGSRRDDVILGTKAGRTGIDDFDYSPKAIRQNVEQSLRLLRTDHVDVLQLHDIEFVPLEGPLGDGIAELQKLKDEGKTRFIGVSGYPIATMKRAMLETEIDVELTYAKGTLLDDSIARELAPIAADRGVGLINAAAVSLGLLTPQGPTITDGGHPATPAIREAAAHMVEWAGFRGLDIAFIANQYAIQRGGCATTVIGTRKLKHVDAAIAAATTPINEQILSDLLWFRPKPDEQQWPSGLAENN